MVHRASILGLYAIYLWEHKSTINNLTREGQVDLQQSKHSHPKSVVWPLTAIPICKPGGLHQGGFECKGNTHSNLPQQHELSIDGVLCLLTVFPIFVTKDTRFTNRKLHATLSLQEEIKHKLDQRFPSVSFLKIYLPLFIKIFLLRWDFRIPT